MWRATLLGCLVAVFAATAFAAPVQTPDAGSAVVKAARKGDVLAVSQSVFEMEMNGAAGQDIVDEFERALAILDDPKTKLEMPAIVIPLPADQVSSKKAALVKADVPQAAVANLREYLQDVRHRYGLEPRGLLFAGASRPLQVKFKGGEVDGLFIFAKPESKDHLDEYAQTIRSLDGLLSKGSWFGSLMTGTYNWKGWENTPILHWKMEWDQRPSNLRTDLWVGGIGVISFPDSGMRRITAGYDDGGLFLIDGATTLHCSKVGSVSNVVFMQAGDHPISMYLYDIGGAIELTLQVERLTQDSTGKWNATPEPLVIRHSKAIEGTRRVEMVLAQAR